MPNPSITQMTPTSPYNVTNSKGLMADLVLSAGALEARFVNLSMAAAAAGLVIELVQNGPPIRIVAVRGSADSDSSVPGFEISWSSATAGTVTTVNINIRDVTGGGFSNVPWTLRAKTSAPGTWVFEPDPAATLSRVMCDPVASLSSSVAGQVPEKTKITLTAAVATTGTVLGAPLPVVSYRFASIGPTAMSPLPVCSDSPFINFNTPGVYADSPVDLVLQVAFSDCAGAGAAWLTNTSTTITLTIQPRPQQVAVLLDRSGSMSGDRWTNAVASARAIVRLFSTFRSGVHPGDRIGLLAFEDTGCTMGAGSVPLTPTLLPLNDPAAADAAICGVVLGNPGSCTPIGQGLVAAMDLLASGGQAADTRYTIVLLTDGYENAGPVQVGPGTPPPGVQPFAVARTATPGRGFVNQGLALFTVGLGGTVDEPVLNNLPAGAIGGGEYLKITDSRDLATAFGQMMSFAQEANPLPTTAAGAGVRFITSAGADRLAVAVLTASSAVQIGFRAAGSGLPFTPGPAAASCPAVNGLAVHAVSLPDVPALGLGGAIEWEVTATAGSLQARDVLAFEDLHLKADLVLDRKAYQLGDTMQVTVHLRDGGDPVTGATVRVLLEAPTLGLGEALVKYSASYRPNPFEPPDPPTGKGLMLASMLRDMNLPGLPTAQVNGIFVDGTNELHDDDGTGDYRNEFARFDHEGTYTMQILAEGNDATGAPFQRMLTLSTWAGLRIDAGTTGVKQEEIKSHPSGLTAVQVTIIPRDGQGRYLGPFWDSDVLFTVKDGRFEGTQAGEPAPPVLFDGSYRRTVLYDVGQIPLVTVSALGTTIGPIQLPPGHPKEPPKDLPKDPPKDLPKDPPKDPPKDLPKDRPKDPPKDLPKDPPKDLPKDRPKDLPKDRPKDLGKDTVKDRPKDLGKDAGKDAHLEPRKPAIADLRLPEDVAGNPVFAQQDDPGQPADVPFTLATGPESEEDT